MEQIFREGDTVYHWNHGKGLVTRINYGNYPIAVDFDGDTLFFTTDGRSNANELPTLSFKPYDLVGGGFSQVRPLPDIKKGTPVFVRYQDESEWYVRVFSHFNENGKLHAFIDADLTGSTKEWDVYSLENPINYDEEI